MTVAADTRDKPDPLDPMNLPIREDTPFLPAVPADPELLAAGWERRTMTDATRQAELVELYESLGLEVKIQSLSADDFGPDCTACAETACTSYTVIYTRRPK
ncbi:MAG: hypothetical protein CMJ87_08785 [Planctomycetes bacterium]|nr:hypothetical protein [Planctomycetota bacterium]